MMEEGINKYKDVTIKLNDFLADNPELSGKEFMAVEKIINVPVHQLVYWQH